MSWENSYLEFKSISPLESIQANQARQKAFNHFLKVGLPTKKLEAWKYTSLNDFKTKDWQPAGAEEVLLSHEQLQSISKNVCSDFHNLVFVDGFLNLTLSDEITESIQILEITAEDFIQNDQHTEVQFLNLAQAFLNKKIQINFSKNKTFEKPVSIIFVQTTKNPIFLSEKIKIKVEENAELTLILNSFNLSETNVAALNLNIEMNIADSARVKYLQLQNENLLSYHFSQTEVILNSKSQFQSLVFSLGSLLTRNYLHLNFKGRHATAATYGLTLIDETQHIDNYTFIQHSIGENESIQHYKSILSGKSQSVFRGRVRIEQDAQKAQSEQLNNNLLLTRDSQANSIPQLEIYADDVKAGHGSTIGQLNSDEIFYFLSRGINQYEAVKMLSYGYAKELIYKFEDKSIQKFLFAKLQDKLERMIQHV